MGRIWYNIHGINGLVKYETLPIPTSAGYNFKGWYTNKTSGSKITSETIVNTTSDITLYAQWETAIPYTESIVTKSGTNLTIETQLYNFAAHYDLIIVGYKDNIFVTMKKVPHNERIRWGCGKSCVSNI